MLSSLPPVGDRDPGVMGAAVAVVGETVVVTISNSVTSGANPLIVTVSVNAWGPRRAFDIRSEEHTSELQSLMRISYAVFCLKKKTKHQTKIYKTKQRVTIQL